jgi:hypothetical protein
MSMMLAIVGAPTPPFTFKTERIIAVTTALDLSIKRNADSALSPHADVQSTSTQLSKTAQLLLPVFPPFVSQALLTPKYTAQN